MQPTTPPDPRGPRVLHVAQPMDAEETRIVRDLIDAQQRNGLTVGTACPEGGPLAEALRARGGEVYGWAATGGPGSTVATEARSLARLVAGVRPDVVHAHSAKAGLAARLALRGRRATVYQPHTWSFEAASGASAALARNWERYAARWSSRVVCVSAAEREVGTRAGVRAQWALIPNGVDTEHFGPRPRAASAALPALLPGVGQPGGPLLVCVGRLTRQQGQDVLLKAWPLIRSRLPGARLVLVGDGPERAPLRRWAAGLEQVALTGPVADPRPWYHAADLVVLPSRREGAVLAPLEAMACARAVLLTEVGGARESLPADHHPSCLVPPGDPAALADAAVRLLGDGPLRHRLALSGRRHVREFHDVRRNAARFAALYRELLTSGRPDPSGVGAR